MRSSARVCVGMLGVLATLPGCGDDFGSADAQGGAGGVDRSTGGSTADASSGTGGGEAGTSGSALSTGGTGGTTATGGTTNTGATSSAGTTNSAGAPSAGAPSAGGTSGSGGTSTGGTSAGGTGSSGGISTGGTSAGGTGSTAGTGGTGGTPALVANGDPCSAASECESSACVDGVCCESACSQACAQCNVAASEGSCVAILSDTACGELACPADTDCRTYEAGNLQDNCEDIGVCVSEAPCTASDVEAGTPCGTAAAPGQCDGVGGCVVEGLASLGETCAVSTDCASSYCVADGSGASICCDTPCDGTCQACGTDGHCDQAPAEDDSCVIDCPDSTTCATYPADPAAGACTAFGVCQTETAFCVADYTAANDSCGTDMVCDGAGECVVDLNALGESCNVGTDCASNYCAANASGNLICCATACDGICEACSAAGACNAVPATDASCSAIDCPDSTPCTTYNADLPDGACASLGVCETEASYCVPDNASVGDSCGTNMVCDAELDCCSTVTGLARGCTAECPCGIAEGVCTEDTGCIDGLVCVSQEVATTKLGFAGQTCMPAHCDNDEVDAADGETSQDCGGECGCTATYEVVDMVYTGTGVTAYDMNDDGTLFAVDEIADNPLVAYAAVMDGTGVVTRLPAYDAYGSAFAISNDGSFVLGYIRCADPPDCTSNAQTPCSWSNGADPVLHSSFALGGEISATGNVVAYQEWSSVMSAYRTTRYVFSSGGSASSYDLSSLGAISDDGTVVVGRLTGDSTLGAVWSIPTSTVTQVSPPVVSEVTNLVDTNTDGSVVLGYSQPLGMGAEADSAFLWRSDGSVEAVPALNANATAVLPRELSADGTRFVGYTGPSTYQLAVLWDEAGGLRTVTDELAARGLELASDLQLGKADFLSPDGTVIVGMVSSTGQFWRVTLLD